MRSPYTMHNEPVQESSPQRWRLNLPAVRRHSQSLPHLSMAFQWSLAVGLLIAVSMGLLGWLALSQQEATFNAQIDEFGQAMASQLAGSAGEPLLAEDHLALQVMLRRITEQGTVLGAAIIGYQDIRVTEGLLPTQMISRTTPFDWGWQDLNGTQHLARTYRSHIFFASVTVGEVVVTLDADRLVLGLNAAMWRMALAATVLIPLAVAIGVFLANRLSLPLRTLASVSSSLAPGEAMNLPHRSGQTEIGHVISAFNRLAQGVQDKERLETLFRRYVPARRSLLLSENDQPLLQAKEVDGSVLFCDVTGFTALSEPLPPTQVVEILNAYFGYIVLAAHSCGGVVDSFSGDCAMVVFGGDEPDTDHALHAATCSVLIREIIRHINLRRGMSGELPVHFRIGVHSGPMAVCELGASERLQPTVIGDTVNVASRLCGLGEPGEIILGASTAEDPQVCERLSMTRLPQQPVHGRRRQVVPYRAEALSERYEARLQSTLERILPIESTC